MPAAVANPVSARTRKQTSARGGAQTATRGAVGKKGAATTKTTVGTGAKKGGGAKKAGTKKQKKTGAMLPMDVIKTLAVPTPPAPTTERRVTFRDQTQDDGKAASANAASMGTSPDAIVPSDAKRRARPAGLSPVAMAKVGSPPAETGASSTGANVPELPPHSQRPAGAVARQAMLADSLGARMAARRRERMRERGAFEHGKAPYPPATTQPAATAAAAGATGAAAFASAASAAVRAGGRTFSNELSQIRAEQQSRVSKLFAQLDRLAAYKGGAAHNKADDARPLPRPAAFASDGATAIVPYQGVGLQHDYQTTVLLNLLRGADSRKWLKEWLLEPGRVEKVREVIERAPPDLQYLLAGILGRRLDEVDEGAMVGEKEVEVTRLGGNTMLAGHGKGGNEERPLPKPLPQKKPLLLLTYRPSASDAPAAPGAGPEVVQLPAHMKRPLAAIVEEEEVFSNASGSPTGGAAVEEVWEALPGGAFTLTAR